MPYIKILKQSTHKHEWIEFLQNLASAIKGHGQLGIDFDVLDYCR